MARRFWPGEDPIGKRFLWGQPTWNARWNSIVGVVGDMRRQALEQQAIPQAFDPHRQRPSRFMSLVVRTASDPLSLAEAVRREIWSVDKTVPVSDVSTVELQLGEHNARRRFQTMLLALFSTLALALAATGIYGVLHYSVAGRTHEIGIRMALGARPHDVLGMVLGQGLRLALAGVVLGLIGALWLTDVISSLLYGVTNTDPATFGVVAGLLTAVALAASYIPARRATKVDPMVALRYE